MKKKETEIIFQKAIFQIISTGHWITDQVGLALKEFGITEAQFNVLRILQGAKGEPMNVHIIQDRMVQRSSNITRIVDKLLSRGFVERTNCPSNRRKVDITITAEGLKMLMKLNAKVEALHKPIMKNLTTEELMMLEQIIIKLKTKKTRCYSK